MRQSVRLLGLTHYPGRRSSSVDEIAEQLSVSPHNSYCYIADLGSQGD